MYTNDHLVALREVPLSTSYSNGMAHRLSLLYGPPARIGYIIITVIQYYFIFKTSCLFACCLIMLCEMQKIHNIL